MADILNKAGEIIKTVIGRVVSIGNTLRDEKGNVLKTGLLFESDSGKRGLNVEVSELSTGKFWQLTIFGEVSFREVKGYTLDTDTSGTAFWTKNHPPLEVGQIVTATGPFTMRSYLSKKTNRPAEKPSLRIYNFRQQVRAVAMPELPEDDLFEVAPKKNDTPKKPPRRSGRRAS
jgi:hypothetical protein